MENSDYIAIASVIVALSAFGVAIWQGWLTRRHNILSVRPKLQINVNTLSGLFYHLENQGLGPAIVNDFKIKYGDTVIENPLEDPYPKIFDEKLYGYEYKFNIPRIGASILPNSKNKLLFSLVPVKPLGEPKEVLGLIYRTLIFEISYKSMYGNELFNCESRYYT